MPADTELNTVVETPSGKRIFFQNFLKNKRNLAVVAVSVLVLALLGTSLVLGINKKQKNNSKVATKSATISSPKKEEPKDEIPVPKKIEPKKEEPQITIETNLPAPINRGSVLFGIRVKRILSQNYNRSVAGIREERYPVIYYTRDATKALYEQNLLTGEEKELLREDGLIRSINFFEKKQLVTYSTIADQYKTTWVNFGVPLKTFSLDTSEKLLLDDSAVFGKPPALSPDGTKLAFGTNHFTDIQSGKVTLEKAYALVSYTLTSKTKNTYYFNELLGAQETGGSGSVPESIVWSKDSNVLYLSLQVMFNNPDVGYSENVFQIFSLNSAGSLQAITTKNKFWYHYLGLEGDNLYFVKEDIHGAKNSRGNFISWFGSVNLKNSSEQTIAGTDWVRGYISKGNNSVVFNGFSNDSGAFISEINLNNSTVNRKTSLGSGNSSPLGLVGWNGNINNIVVVTPISFSSGEGVFRFQNLNLVNSSFSNIKDINMVSKDFNF